MFRKVTIALLATAALAMLAPDVVSARGGDVGRGGFAACTAASAAVFSTEVAALVEAVLTMPDLITAVFAARRFMGADTGPDSAPA